MDHASFRGKFCLLQEHGSGVEPRAPVVLIGSRGPFVLLFGSLSLYSTRYLSSETRIIYSYVHAPMHLSGTHRIRPPDHLTHAPARLGQVLLAPRAERRRRAGHKDGGGLRLVGDGPRCVREAVPTHEALPLADLVRARVRVRVRVRVRYPNPNPKPNPNQLTLTLIS